MEENVFGANPETFYENDIPYIQRFSGITGNCQLIIEEKCFFPEVEPEKMQAQLACRAS